MALSAGTRLGPYEIVSVLGAGGMGEVYRATDLKLKRQVAIKTLPASLASDPDRLARFQREAEVLASLNHPNIAAIYGLEEADGVRALVMELVEGSTLADRIALGAIPPDEALPIARQVAEALEAAHENGIIHRDLKPANIKVRSDGAVKVLDFGLAKALAPDPVAATAGDISRSPTITTPAATRMGMILGTAAYMSPEQARAKPLDRRTDIWSFGCVLYEMLTGRRTFEGEDVSEVLASVLAREPDLAALPAATPVAVRRVLERCLRKDRHQRLRDIGDARIEIQEALSKRDIDQGVPPARSQKRERAVWMATLTALALALAASLAVPRSAPPSVSEMRVEIVTPPSTAPLAFALSPDGRQIAYVATANGQSQLWLRSLESGSAKPVPGTDGAESLFWSPNSRSVGFFAEGRLKRLDVDGGSVRTLSSAPFGQTGSWNDDDVIVFASLGRPLARIKASGGDPTPLSGLQTGSHFAPQFLPDGHRFLYYVRGDPSVRGVYLGHLDEPLEPRRLLECDSGAFYVPSGHLIFIRQGTLFAQRFDPVNVQLTGNMIPLAERVGLAGPVEGSGISVSHTGVIAYRPISLDARRQFAWFDRTGKEIGKVGDSAVSAMNSPALSPDGQRLAVYRSADGNPDIWLIETKRGALSRLTSDTGDDVMPIWSPDGSRIVFSSTRTGKHSLYLRAVFGGGSDDLLHSTGQPIFATDWSRDGRFVLFHSEHAKSGMDIWALEVTRSGHAFPVVQTNFEEQYAQFSPDGNWIAYQSDESGRVETYVQPFGERRHKWPVSTNGGTQIRWRGDGKELFYLALDDRLMAVPIQLTANAPDVGTPVPLFPSRLGSAAQRADYRYQYVVSPDGQRFLLAPVPEAATLPITLILNWQPRQ